MTLGFRQLLAIAHNALAEILRAPLFCLVFIAALLLAGVIPTLDYLAFLEKRRLVADSLLALTIMAGVFAAASSATAVVGDEIRRRTALAVLSKPVSRGVFLSGKLLGIAAALAVLWSALALAVLWGSRVAGDDYHPETYATRVYFIAVIVALLYGGAVDFFLGRSFAMAAALALPVCLLIGFVFLGAHGEKGRAGEGWELIDWRLLPAAALTYPAMLLTAALAMAVAIRLEATPTLLVTGLLLCLGLVSDYLFGGHAGFGATLLHAVTPNFQPFWAGDRLAGESSVSWSEVGRAAAYAVTYAGAVLTLSVAVFERRELG